MENKDITTTPEQDLKNFSNLLSRLQEYAEEIAAFESAAKEIADASAKALDEKIKKEMRKRKLPLESWLDEFSPHRFGDGEFHAFLRETFMDAIKDAVKNL